MKYFASILLAAGPAFASILWDGRFNDLTSSTDLDKWSFANPVGPYQYYIHGSGNVTEYVNLSSDFKNPADTDSNQGVKISLTSTAYWNGQNMRRTELIPETDAAINSGSVVYHFSIKRSDTNAPSSEREHQIAFFESHFCELKYGGDSGTNLEFFANSKSQYSLEFVADVWHNVAYEIDFSGNTVAFWHSTGSDALTKIVDAVSVTASSNGADWHLGVLELQKTGVDDADEDLFFSGVYIEDGDVTTSVSAGGSSDSGSSASSSSVASSTTAVSSSTAAASTVSTTSAAATTTSSSSSAAATTTAASTSSVATTSSASSTTSQASSTTSKATTLSTVVASSTSAAATTVAEQVTSTSSAASPTKTKSSCLARRRNRKRAALARN